MKLAPARAALVLAAAIVVVLVVALLGRRERKDANRKQVAGIVAVASRVGLKTPSAYRLTGFADCLLYSEQGDPYALEVCYDTSGRAIQAIDRYPREETRIWSVRYDPELTTVFAQPSTLFSTFKLYGAFTEIKRYPGHLPLADEVRLAPGTEGDSGPIPVRIKH